MTRILAISVLILASLSAPSVAVASEARTVQTSDLDLSKPNDIARLQVRMAYATKTVCDNADNVFPEAAKEIHACERDTNIMATRLVQAAIEHRRSQLAAR